MSREHNLLGPSPLCIVPEHKCRESWQLALSCSKPFILCQNCFWSDLIHQSSKFSVKIFRIRYTLNSKVIDTKTFVDFSNEIPYCYTLKKQQSYQILASVWFGQSWWTCFAASWRHPEQSLLLEGILAQFVSTITPALCQAIDFSRLTIWAGYGNRFSR